MLIIGNLISAVISVLVIIHILFNTERYGPKLYSIFLIIIILFLGIIYPLLFSLTSHVFYEEKITLLLWRVAIIIGVISLAVLSSLYNFILEYKKLNYTASLIICLLGGIVIAFTFEESTIEIIRSGNYYFYEYSSEFLVFNILFQFVIVSFFWYIELKAKKRISQKDLNKLLVYVSIQFSNTILLYTLYLITHNILFGIVHIFILWIGQIGAYYVIFHRPNFFILLTHRINHLILVHKSGILLFSYDFNSKKIDWSQSYTGEILIGINHVLANYNNRQNALKVIKMRDRFLLFTFCEEYGIATLLISNQNNKLLAKSLNSFLQEFKQQFGSYLRKINKNNSLIDTSIFNYSKELLQNTFQMFTSNYGE